MSDSIFRTARPRCTALPIHAHSVPRFLTTGALLLVLMCASFTLTVPAGAVATTGFTVTATVFTDPPPGACATTGSGPCSLREAVLFANGIDDTTIILLAGTYLLTMGPVGLDDATTGDLNLTAPMTIRGAGAGTTIIDGAGMTPTRDRIFLIDGAAVTISGVTIRNGQTSSVDGAGGIYSNVGNPLILNNVTVSGNTATAGDGGGIRANGGTVSFTNLTLTGNHASGNGGGVAITSTFAGITGSVVSGNQTTAGPSVGGGVSVASGGNLTINGTTLSGNSATSGGGVAALGGSVLTLLTSTVNANNATVSGGGISTATASEVNVRNSTLSGNSAPSGGAAVKSGPSLLTFSFSTLAANTSGVTSSGFATSPGTFLTATILANTAANCASPDNDIGSGDFNLSSDGTCVTFLNQPNDLHSTNPKLGALASNGGMTQTHALLAGSPAIDRVPGGGGCNGLGITTDQRGIGRPAGAGCDVGAYEFMVNALPDPKSPGPPAGPSPSPLPGQRPNGPAGGQAPNPLPVPRSSGAVGASAGRTGGGSPGPTPVPCRCIVETQQSSAGGTGYP